MNFEVIAKAVGWILGVGSILLVIGSVIYAAVDIWLKNRKGGRYGR